MTETLECGAWETIFQERYHPVKSMFVSDINRQTGVIDRIAGMGAIVGIVHLIRQRQRRPGLHRRERLAAARHRIDVARSPQRHGAVRRQRDRHRHADQRRAADAVGRGGRALLRRGRRRRISVAGALAGRHWRHRMGGRHAEGDCRGRALRWRGSIG